MSVTGTQPSNPARRTQLRRTQLRRTQLLKGMLDLCVLAVLQDEPSYGYKLVERLRDNGLELVAEGSIYPLLTRLEKQGLLSSHRARSPEGPSRKYYTATDTGLAALATGQLEWQQFSSEVSKLLERPS